MIRIGVKISDEGKDAKKLVRQLKSDYVARFGWTGPKALETHAFSGETVEDDMVTHEFGGVTEDFQGNLYEVPRRSVIGDYFDQNLPSIFTDTIKAISSVVNGKTSMLQSLKSLGEKHVKGMKAKIKSGISPPLSPMTLERREVRGNNDDTPLYDTGQAHDALESEAKKK